MMKSFTVDEITQIVGGMLTKVQILALTPNELHVGQIFV